MSASPSARKNCEIAPPPTGLENEFAAEVLSSTFLGELTVRRKNERQNFAIQDDPKRRAGQASLHSAAGGKTEAVRKMNFTISSAISHQSGEI